jgi:hypothetical protein
MDNIKVDYNEKLYFNVPLSSMVITRLQFRVFQARFQTSPLTYKENILISSLFWDVRRRSLVVIYVAGKPIGPTLKGHAVQEGCP